MERSKSILIENKRIEDEKKEQYKGKNKGLKRKRKPDKRQYEGKNIGLRTRRKPEKRQ